ncbi:MAG TPA: hypothetical protein VGB02_14185 [Pyrinomonadaceae bacterium]|jgi:hypothetical protein
MKFSSPSRRDFLNYLASAIVFLYLATPATGQTLEWEVVNPFPFIHHQESIDKLRDVYRSLSVKSIYNLGVELQKQDEARVTADLEKVKACEVENKSENRYRCQNKIKAELQAKDKQQLKLSYLGWFSDLAANNHEKTCWNSQTLLFREFEKDPEFKKACEGYLHPKSQNIRVWLNNPVPLNNNDLHWFIGEREVRRGEPCQAKYNKNNCVEFLVPVNLEKPLELTIWVKKGDGTPLASIPVMVKNTLIVGLGDSFASGEGNPDIPREFRQGRNEGDLFYPLGKRKSPLKDKTSKVGWLDQRCHRSMYSYQFQTALGLALTNPHEVVTFVSYSCSGAKTNEIISASETPVETMSSKIKELKEGNQYKLVPPQLESLKKVLNGRTIDYLLLSTGGNDIGFVDYVAYVVTSKLLRKLKGKTPSHQTIKEIEELSNTYKELHQKLLNAVTIDKCKSDNPCSRILLTPYPNIFNDETGKTCEAKRDEFTYPFKLDADREYRIRFAEKNVFNELREAVNRIVNPEKPDKRSEFLLGWTLVTNFDEPFKTHGFCAQTKCEREKADAQLSEFVMPKYKGEWTPSKPWTYRSYKKRGRWVRLPVDSKLTTDQIKTWWRFAFDLDLVDDRSNIMHPTAEGHAAMADANLLKILEQKIKSDKSNTFAHEIISHVQESLRSSASNKD